MADETKRPLKVFLCHASGDKPVVRELYKRLIAEGVDAWLDQEKLLPGQDWRVEIPRAVRDADVVVICLSNKSITKEGYVQKEIRFALDSAEEKPEGTIFLIPARLEDCIVPERLDRWQWVDLFDENGFLKLLRSLKLRADKVGAAIEPSANEDADSEVEHRLDQLYTEGLAAFWVEDWDRACQRFQAILRERPNHKNAAEKLAQAERQRSLAKLYAQGTEAYKSQNWVDAIQAFEGLLEKSTDYKDAAQILRDARKQKQLRELYLDAKRLHAAQKWQAVVRVFDQIATLDPQYPDPENLLSSAQQESAEQKRLEELSNLYRQGVHQMDEGQWYEARILLEQVHKTQLGFLDTERLLRKVENEIIKIEELKQRNDQINILYEQAHGLVRSKSWRMVLDKMEEIQRLDDQFVDKDGIAEKARAEFEHDEQIAQQQNMLAAMYAESVRLLKEGKYQQALDKWEEVKTLDSKYPDRQHVQSIAIRKLTELGKPVRSKPQFVITRPIWFGIIALIALGVVLISMTLLARNKVDIPPLSTVASSTKNIPTSNNIVISTATRELLSSTAIPPTVVPEPGMYDDFNNPLFNGTFNGALWGEDNSAGKISQENGLLMLALNIPSSNIGLNSIYQYKLIELTSVEAKLMLDTASKDGNIYMGIAGSDGQSICGIQTSSARGNQMVYCTSDYFGNPQRVYTKGIGSGSWHILRIEFDPQQMRFSNWVDGTNIGSYAPRDPEKYKDLTYDPVVHIDSGTSANPNVTGYADYLKLVRIGD